MEHLINEFIKADMIYTDCLDHTRNTKSFLKEISKLHGKLSKDYLARLSRYVPDTSEKFKNVSLGHREFSEAFVYFNSCIAESTLMGHYKLKLQASEIKRNIKKNNEYKNYVSKLSKFAAENNENLTMIAKIMDSVAELVSETERNTAKTVRDATKNHMTSAQRLFNKNVYKNSPRQKPHAKNLILTPHNTPPNSSVSHADSIRQSLANLKLPSPLKIN